MVLLNATRQVILASSVRQALGFWQRLRGLLGTSNLPHCSALVIPRCRAVHTVGMRYAIDVVFADDRWRVVGMQPDMKPGQFSSFIREAYYAIELPVGTINRTGTQIGDTLHLANGVC